jgi:hypothetical protein
VKGRAEYSKMEMSLKYHQAKKQKSIAINRRKVMSKVGAVIRLE